MTAKETKPKTNGAGCLGLIVIIAIIAVIASSSGGSKTNPRADANAYITKLGSDTSQVQASVQVVAIDIGSKASINRVAQDAQQAHDTINNVRDNLALTPPASGALNTAETEVFGAANDMKNAMGALVAYTGTPNPATLAQFTTQFQTAKSEWNDGVGTIWRTAGQSGAPTL